MMKLIREEVEKVEVITETVGGKKQLYIQGVFLQSECVNRNGRMYPFQIMEREVNRYNENYVQKGRALGELGHPDGPTVNLDRVSHKITELKQSGNNFIGKAQILSTPMGKIAESLLKDGVTLGVSSRGIGSLRENTKGFKEVGKILCLQLQQILLQILLHLTLLFRELWKVKSGFGMVVFCERN